MTKNKIIFWSFVNSIATMAYIIIVASFMINAEKILGRINGVAGPVLFLMLFVLSAGVTGALVLGRPVLKYLDGDRKGAIYLFCATLSWLFVFTVIWLISNIIF